MNRAQFLFWVVLAILIPSIACATLEFSEIGSISIPDQGNVILYYQDIQLDSIKEVVAITQSGNCFVYNGLEGTLLWQMTGVSYGGNCKFQDMNNDGDIDLVCGTPQLLSIYDLVDSQLIWASPPITQEYIFTVGDRNSDDSPDIIIAHRQPWNSDMALDTVWVDIYDGPSYQLSGQFYFLVNGYRTSGDGDNADEDLLNIGIDRLSGSQGLENRIIIFTNYLAEDNNYYNGEWMGTTFSLSGRVIIIDPLSYLVTASLSGKYYQSSKESSGDSTYLYVLSGSASGREDLMYGYFYRQSYYLYVIGSDGVINNSLVWEYYNPHQFEYFNWTYGFLEDFENIGLGKIVVYGVWDTLTVFSYPDSNYSWQKTNLMTVDAIIYHSNLLFNSPQILTGNPRSTYDGFNGRLTGVFTGPYRTINAVVDLDNNGEDEIINYGPGIIRIFHVTGEPEDAIGDENEAQLPNSLKLSSYPNPFNAQTTISYSLSETSPVSISIYNLLGQKVATLFDQPQQPGEHSIVWNANQFTSGLYFARLEAGEMSLSIKLILLK